jgi:hypothetical protein
VPLRSSAASNLYFANDGRDLPYFLSLTSLAAAMEVAAAIGSAEAVAAGSTGAVPVSVAV